MIYYNKDGYKVRKSTKQDIAYLAKNMRKSDIEEIWAADRKTPEAALREGLEQSIFACTVENGSPIAMFGICPYSITGNKASVWMLATDDIDKLKRRFARRSREFVKMMLEFYPYLENMVDDRNKRSIEWLKFCGAKIDEPVPYGAEKLPFRHFSFTRSK